MKKVLNKVSLRGVAKVVLALGMVGGVLYALPVGAEQTIGDVAAHVTGSFKALAKLITAAAYIAGMGFAIGAIMKFKAHKDNPTQIPIGTPIALIFIAAALIFLPTIFSVAGYTLFGAGTETGGIGGVYEFDQ